MLTPAQETNSFYKLFKNSVKPYHEAWKGEESKNDIARSVLTALSERNPTGRFLKKVVGDNDKYVIMQKPSVWNKIIKALERNAPQVKLPSKRKRRTSKRMLESCMVEIPPPNTTKQKKRRGRSRPKQVLPSSTTGSSSVESAAVQADPYDLGKLAKRFMHYAFVSAASDRFCSTVRILFNHFTFLLSCIYYIRHGLAKSLYSNRLPMTCISPSSASLT